MTYEVALEILLSFIYLLPISFFRYAPFVSKFRFCLKSTIILYFSFFFLSNGILAYCGLYSCLTIANRARFILYFLMTLFSFFLVKENVYKQLYVICFYGNFSFLFSSAGLLIEALLFGHSSSNIYFKIASMIILLIPMLPIIYHVSFKSLNEIILREEYQLWNILCIIGMIEFFLTTVLSVPFKVDAISAGRNALIRLILSVGAFLINSTTILLIRDMLNANDAKNAAESERQHLQIQQYQYRHMQEQIENSRRFRHDFKHHGSFITSIINDKTLSDHEKIEKLMIYCDEYFHAIPSAEELHFCNNYSLNLMINYYYSKAERLGIHLIVKANLPAKLAIKDTDLCIIIGNLLLNAIEGAETAPPSLKQISCTIVKNDRNLLISIENGFDGQIYKTKETFHSTKHPGNGIGITNIKNIANRYDGTCYFEHKDNLFSVRIHLILEY